MKRIVNFFIFVDSAFARIIDTLLVLILLFMTALIASQVVLRNIFNSGISWADVVSRHAVLWVAFLGAMLATRSRQHVAIDALTKFIPKRQRNMVRIGLDTFACFVAALLSKTSLLFVMGERDSGQFLFNEVPLWIAEIIIPFGFAMISIEYAIGIGLDIWRLRKDSSHIAGQGRVVS